MSEAKHTPGRWFSDVDGFGGNRVGAFGFETYDGTSILAQVRTLDGVTFEQARANARLMAAAPFLLEMAKWAESAIAPFSKEPAEKSGIARLREAIAQAEGRSS